MKKIIINKPQVSTKSLLHHYLMNSYDTASDKDTYNYDEVVNLLRRGADPNYSPSSEILSPLGILIFNRIHNEFRQDDSQTNNNRIDIINLLLKNGAKADQILFYLIESVAFMPYSNVEQDLRILLKAGVDPDTTMSQDTIIKLQRYSPTNMPLNKGTTPLILLSRLVKYLHENHRNAMFSDKILHEMFNKEAKLAQLFISYGANIDATDSEGMTALDYALQNGRTDLVKVLENAHYNKAQEANNRRAVAAEMEAEPPRISEKGVIFPGGRQYNQAFSRFGGRDKPWQEWCYDQLNEEYKDDLLDYAINLGLSLSSKSKKSDICMAILNYKNRENQSEGSQL